MMGYRWKNKLRGKDGFTLLEMIIVVAIMAVLAGIISVGIMGYMTTAYMNRVNETAKTVFLAAQNYLTQEKQQGNLSAFNENAKAFGGEVTKDMLKEIFLAEDAGFDFDAYEDKYGTDNIRYILLNEGEGESESKNPVYTIVKNYINDKDLLKHTFLIEYDTKSGVIRSVFYTEKASAFTYDGDRDKKDNVILRGGKSLRSKRQGYYGVDTTSLLKYNLDLYSPKNSKLVNGERLYVEWTEANYLSQDEIKAGATENANEAFDDADLREYLAYDAEIYRVTKDGDGEKLVTIKNIQKGDSKGATLAKAEESVKDDGLVIAYQEKSNTYQLMLDCLHHSIFDLFDEGNSSKELDVEKEISASDMLYVKLSVHLTDNGTYEGESVPVTTNQQSANYGGGAKTYSPTGLPGDEIEVYGNGWLHEDGKDSEDEKAFSIYNARQLNNVRNAQNTACFVQRGNIDWSKPESDRTATAGLFEPLSFTRQGGSAADSGIYKGIFRTALDGGNPYQISNLSINRLTGPAEKNVGMFRQNQGEIRGLYLLNAKVQGAYQTGAVAGSNGGLISGVTLDNCQVQGSFYIGGVTGKNLAGGQLLDIQCDAAVSGDITKSVTDKIKLPDGEDVTYCQYIGGIAGLNQGSAGSRYTSIVNETGEAKRSTRIVSGLKSVGGIFGANRTGAAKKVTDCVNFNEVAILPEVPVNKEIRDFGGIAGTNEKNSEITKCLNRALTFLEKDNKNPERIENIGGIAGRNDGILKQCSSILSDDLKLTKLTQECVAAVKKGSIPKYSGVHVGGIAGLNDENGDISLCSTDTAVLGYRMAGGLIGLNDGNFACGKDYKTAGLVVAGKDTAGGIIGSNNGKRTSTCYNEANVFAGAIAGGILGANGTGGQYTSTAQKGQADYYADLLNPRFEETNMDKEIVNCQNTGFVYALEKYSGGIAGINFGAVTNANSVVSIGQDSRLYGQLGKADYEKLARADCVGGIAGFNKGVVTGGNSQYVPTVSELYGNDFTGGIVGLNQGPVSKYPVVEGNIYGLGNGIGGFIGLNLDGQSVSNMAFNDGMQIYGGYFVGGIIGCNVSDGNTDSKISSAATQASKQTGQISGKAYVGGIIGYQTRMDGGFAQLVGNDLAKRVESAYEPYETQTGNAQTDAMTMFIGCTNKSAVSADRYVGGIVGYNSGASALLVSKSTNFGTVKIADEKNQVKDGYYFIGGITGRNSAGGVIDQCVNDGSVVSPSIYLGGICEVNEGYVQFCSVGKSQDYNEEGGISGSHSVGGLVGKNSKNVVQCSSSQYARISGGDNTGGIVGTNDVSGVITGDVKYAWIREDINQDMADRSDPQCVVSGSVKGADNTGGIVGLNEGRVENVSVENATVTGNTYVGGFIGNNTGLLSTDDNPDNETIIEGLSNHARLVSGVHQVGGIVGRHSATVIENCSSYGTVEATGGTGYAGGITGSVEENITIRNSQNYGVVTSKLSQAGGIAGNNKGMIEECENYGSVTGSLTVSEESAIGGITGVNEAEGSVAECISAKNPDSETPNVIQGIYTVGGMIGLNRGVLSNKDKGRTVDISIQVAETKLDKAGCVGGVIGRFESTSTDTIKGYVYSGNIQVSAAAAQGQYIGGIIGRLYPQMTLEDCIFDGKITGSGNLKGKGDFCGVGGLTGYSEGTIIVYKNEEGIYASNTEGSYVEGCTNVGGVAGTTYNTHKILLKTGNGNQELSQISENQDADSGNDIYYVNLAVVSGFERAGGFYGRIYEDKKKGIALSYYQNGRNGNEKAGNIRFNYVSGQSITPVSLGGIIGSIYQASTQGVTLSQMKNYGSFGDKDSYQSKSGAVGGIIGSSQNNGKTIITDAVNYGEIYCGSQEIGGIAGRSNNTTFTDCTNYGSIKVKAATAGGIVGSAQNTVITGTGDKPVVNEGEIIITGDYQDCGGIAGYLSGTSSITGAENRGKITINGSGRKDLYTGGIVGLVNGKIQLLSCINNGEVAVSESYVAGGIAGYINVTSITLKNCENNGKVFSEFRDVGGIAGLITNTDTLTMTDNVNNGDVYAKFRGGGLIGRIQTGSGAKWNLSNCTNNGNVHATLPKTSTDQVISRIGGCIGYSHSNANVSGLVNNGEVVIDQKDAKTTIKDVYMIGGIFGYLRNNSTTAFITAENCRNQGTFSFQLPNTGNSLYEVGGIAGNIEYLVQLDSCKNSAAINMADVKKNSQHSIGGITGRSHENTKQVYCVNYADVLGNAYVTKYVGGISGNSEGLIYSCSTENKTEKVQNIRGKENVGGLVGWANGSGCKISSIVNKENTGYAISSNSFRVTGGMGVGGIAGFQRGATIYTVMNRPEAEIVLLKTDGSKPGMAAGGITGLAGFDGQVPGVIANCYSFGAVRFSENKSMRYVGGMIGYRNWKDGSGGKVTAVSIKDSFYLYEEGSHELVDISQPDTKIESAVLAVGNEPEGKYGLDMEDQQYGSGEAPELNTGTRFRWSREAYEKMYRELRNPNPGEPIPGIESWDQMDTVLDHIVPFYDRYKLPVPETSTVVSNDGYGYTLPIEKMPGFCEYLEVSLFTEDTTDEAVKAGTAAPLLTTTKDVDMDHQLTDVAFDLRGIAGYEQYVGKVLRVAVKAHGVKQEVGADGNIIYTADSDLEVVQEFVVMPVLPTPEVEVAGQEGAELTFRITNWAAYQQAAGAVYETIKNDPVLSQLPVYQAFLNGLDNFTITDYYLAKENGARDTKYVDTWNITKNDINADGQFKIDYTKSKVFNAQNSNRKYHDWDIQAVASNRSSTLDAAAVRADTSLYRYVSSYLGGLKFMINAKTKLEKPRDLQSRYTGGTDWANDPDTPGYELSFLQSTSPEDAIAGYLITVTNPANGNTHIFNYVPKEQGEEEPEEARCVYQLTKDILIGQLGLDLSPDSQPVQLDWTVSTQKNDSPAAEFFLNSDNAIGAAAVLKKAHKVEEDMWITADNANSPNELTFHWNDNYRGDGYQYLISYEVKNGDIVIDSKTNQPPLLAGEQEYKIVLPADNGKYTVNFTVVRKGEGSKEAGNVVTLDSDPASVSKVIGEKLAGVTNVTAVFDRADADYLYYKVSFDIPPELTADICKGFWIQAVDAAGSGDELLENALEIPIDAALPIEIAIPAADKGKQFYVHVISQANDVSHSDSERQLSGLVIIPSQQLSPVISQKASMKVDDALSFDLTDPNAGNALQKDALAAAKYTFEWDFADPGNVHHQKIEILSDAAVLYSQETAGNEIKLELQQDWSAYAGKKLVLRITNIPLDASQSLPSDAAELEFYVPKIKLEGPALPQAPDPYVVVQKDGIAVTPNTEIPESDYPGLTYPVSWQEPKFQAGRTGTRFVLKYEEKDAGGNVTSSVNVPFQIQTAAGDGTAPPQYDLAPDGEYVLACTSQEADYTGPDGQAQALAQHVILTGIDKAYAAKELKLEISYVTGPLDADPVPAEGESYQDSLPIEGTFILPKLQAGVVTLGRKESTSEKKQDNTGINSLVSALEEGNQAMTGVIKAGINKIDWIWEKGTQDGLSFLPEKRIK